MNRFLDKENTIAGPGFNRWLVPPAALAIHLCIGMAYGFSVFWLPLSKALGIKEPLACPEPDGFWASLISALSSTCDWKVTTLGWMYTLFFVFLGSSAAIFGGWLEHAGPRKAGVVSAACWCSGLLISALGVHTHQIWLMWLGSGVIGGIGLGLGYISPVSTLIKWFPDRRGMATGMAIMGFGGGAVVGSPLAVKLMDYFASPTSVGVTETFVVMAVIYFVFMLGGAFGYRVPPAGWKPAGWNPPPAQANSMITQRHVHAKKVWGIPQFWLIWMVLMCNVAAGIGVIGMASPMVQEIFAGQLIGVVASFNQLTLEQKLLIAPIAGAFPALLSLFNIVGRFFWASISDYIGRKATYAAFFVLGFVLYAAAPTLGQAGSLGLFVLGFCIILSMYGGGFATIPAYLSDLFGTQMVGAIHGRLLTSWSVAGIVGPYIINKLRDDKIAAGMAKAEVYNETMYWLAGLLVIGFICNLLIRPLAAHHFMSDDELAEEKRLAREKTMAADSASGAATSAATSAGAAGGSSTLVVVLAWAAVCIPLLWGIADTLGKATVFFK